MSRLKDALRQSASTVHRAAEEPSEVFDSPWSLGQVGPESPVLPEPARRDNEARPAPESFTTGLLSVQPMPEGFSLFSTQWLLSPEVDAAIVEQFKRLAASLLHGQRDGRLKVIIVTSAVPGEGKTLTSLNIALVLAESYRRRVLLIDADLRRPRLSEAANLAVTQGLGEVLKAEDERKASITQLTANLWFLPAGRPDPEPLSGLTSARMQHLLEEAAERFDFVIVDTPPVTVVADTGLLGALADAAVLVVRAGETAYPAVRQAIETLGRDRIFGVVLNGVDRQRHDDYSGYYPGQ